MTTVTARKPARKISKPASPFVIVDLPNLPSFEAVRQALLGLGVSAAAHKATIEAWEASAFFDVLGRLTAGELEQRAYESAAAALYNATKPAPAPEPTPTPAPAPTSKGRFEPSKADQAWWAENSPNNRDGYDVIGRRPARTSGRAPSDRYTEESAEAMDCRSSFGGHDA